MRKIFFQFIIIFLLMFSVHSRAQNQLEGVLHTIGDAGGFDWIRPSIFTKQIPAYGAIKLQSRFIWNKISTNSDHAIVAFAQGTNNHWVNSNGEYGLLQYGVGAYVGSDGLSLELWFNPNNGYYGSAYVWNSENICGIGVGPDAIPFPQLCLSTSSAAPAYVTPRPSNWFIEVGRAYWVCVKITADSIPGWYIVEADLIDPSYAGWLVQTARLGFRKNDYFPLGGFVEGTLGLAALGKVDADFVAFDYGF